MKHTQGKAKVASLAAEYKKNGYTVQVEPVRTLLPFDLGNYQPDLLAEKDGEHLIIEVKSSEAPLSLQRFRDLAEIIKGQPGWRFLFVGSSPDAEETSLPREPLSWSSITDRVRQAKRLHQAGEPEAAILIFWSALEALLRRHAESIALPIEHLSVRALIDYLYSEAELSFEQLEKVRQLSTQRNQLAHGFQIQEADQIARTLEQLTDELLHDWQPNRQAS